MDNIELEKIIKEFRDNGLTNEEISHRIYDMYKEKKIDIDEFMFLAEIIGWKLKSSFVAKERPYHYIN